MTQASPAAERRSYVAKQGETAFKDTGGAARRPSYVEKWTALSTWDADSSTRAGYFSTWTGSYVEKWRALSTREPSYVERSPSHVEE
jgi:hypothetical protein